ncbi:dihydroorotate dehydrogenase family protein [Caldicellulosiruptor obsidiansis OB47]|mgnify:CR=1 FL=1|uniref:Dihydroorotate dehydrogenase n=1 Tax=Caldicellulosiruptor obsidiansis (strain ATCC BAA-2073 / JCM 16842 / OB47) TaxID=608506 RepID=D9TKD8_CALOO|nr:dihydroorotate dehydrogenase [Caldicellulosiruptor obsidiansis]ADL42470.1 dihydroorotate dehydrogenase family protein [Caldicellulosiruptor obsidiansis OB47]
MNLEVEIAGIKLKNPVIAASGTFGFGREFSKLIDLNLFGGISTKGITLKKRTGNPQPRLCEVYGGIINSVGLENPGVEAFVNDELPFLRKFDTKIIANINGFSKEEFMDLAKIVSPLVDMIEVNLSCPNVKEGGMVFGKDPNKVYEITKEVKKVSACPVIVKLTPNVTDITQLAVAAEKAGADAISLINTISAMAIDIETRKPLIKMVTGGLSGPAIKPIAVRMVYECFKKVKIPIIGMGGIMNHKDAIEFIIAGATAIQIGTVNFINPNAVYEIKEGIEAYLEIMGFNSIRELVGNINI